MVLKRYQPSLGFPRNDEEYCSKCGHFMSDVPLERHARSAMEIDPGQQSLSWKLAYEKWRENGDA